MNLIGISFSCFQRKKENNQNGHDLITFYNYSKSNTFYLKFPSDEHFFGFFLENKLSY